MGTDTTTTTTKVAWHHMGCWGKGNFKFVWHDISILALTHLTFNSKKSPLLIRSVPLVYGTLLCLWVWCACLCVKWQACMCPCVHVRSRGQPQVLIFTFFLVWKGVLVCYYTAYASLPRIPWEFPISASCLAMGTQVTDMNWEAWFYICSRDKHSNPPVWLAYSSLSGP